MLNFPLYFSRIIPVVVILNLFVTGLVLGAATYTSDEYRIKTAFLYNFAQFIDWPKEIKGSEEMPFAFCYISRESMSVQGQELQDRTVDKRNITVKYLKSPEELKGGCQILFVHRSMNNELKRIIKIIGDKPTLIVGDEIDLARKGGDINFIKIHNRIRFEINLTSIRNKKLNISSEMLKLAVSVFGGGNSMEQRIVPVQLQ